MKHTSLYLLLLFLLPALSPAQTVVSISIDGTINPASADFIHNSIQKAQEKKAQCIIIHLNTPGGLLKSTRYIVRDILESQVPVIVFVSPAGADAGSAGVFITLAAHVAAMAPGTNIGAAHPVALQGGIDTIMNEKATNDAAAFIRTIAEKRKRNLQWADDAVRRSYSITENEALEKNVIDMVARNDHELLEKIHGRKIDVGNGTITLQTRSARLESIEMGSAEKILNILSDPNIAYIMLMLGLYGIMFELFNPGAILPGIVGVICLILAFYSMHTLPINYAGLALIIFGIILFLLEIKVVSHGMLAIGGVVSLLLGSMMLIRASSTLEFVSISRSVIISATAVTALFFFFVIGLGIRAQLSKTSTGVDGIIGAVGESLGALDPVGTIRVHGEVWNAEAIGGNILHGEKVKVTGIKNLKLFVEKMVG